MKRIKKVLSNNKGMMMVEFMVMLSVILVLVTVLVGMKDALISTLYSVSESVPRVESDNNNTITTNDSLSDENKILNIEEIMVK